MKKILILSALFALTAATMRANDGTYYTSGNQLVPLQETDISVRSEVLTISIQDNGYARVDVNYTFYNPGQSTKKVLMGFEANPPYNADYKFYPNGIHPYIKNFTVEMNGNKLAYKNAPCINDGTPLHKLDPQKKYRLSEYGEGLVEVGKEDGDALNYAYVYYFEAEFKPGINTVRHTYSYQMSVIVGIPYDINYKLSPAARWSGGKIGDFTLIIRADKTAKHFLVNSAAFPGGKFSVIEGTGKIRKRNIYDNPMHEVSLRNGAIRLNMKNFAPESDLSISCCSPYGGYDEDNRIGSTYDRTFNFVNLFESETVYNDFEKRIMRNLPYANRGHVFKDARLKAYFESLWWYMPDPAYKDSTADFTKVDWQYIKGN